MRRWSRAAPRPVPVVARAPLIVLLLALGLIAACAPVVVPSGPVQQQAQIGERVLHAFDGARLPLHAWLPAEDRDVEAVILALHGFNDYGHFFASPGTFLAERGIASYAYDQRGFGMAPRRGFWPGMETMVADARAALLALRRRHPDAPLYLLGESMGGAVALLIATDPDPPLVDGVILAAPAVWGRDTMPWYQTAALWLSAHSVPWLTLTGRSMEIVPSDNVEMLRALARDPLVIKRTRVDAVYGLADLMDAALAAAGEFDSHALILYGERDELVPKQSLQAFFANLPTAGDPPTGAALAVAAGRPYSGPYSIAIYEHGYHMLLRDLQAETVWSDIAAWITDPASPLPSGADVRAIAGGACRVWNLCDKVLSVPVQQRDTASEGDAASERS